MRVFALLLVVVAIVVPTSSSAHCEIPCGIYDDAMRVRMILEHVETIEKSMNQVDELATDPAHNANQLVRWVTNKESHADEIQGIVTQYFMTQRIKPGAVGSGGGTYEQMLATLHQILIAAMKCKQTTDLANAQEVRRLTNEFADQYFSEEDLRHVREH